MENEEPKNRDELLLQKLRQVVLENIQNDQFGVEDLARSCGISRSQLHRKLRRLKQKSISQFIREIRLNEALTLLQKNAGTVSEIAYQVGFSNPTYFNTSFRNHFGYPPGEASLRAKIGHEPKEQVSSPDVQEKKPAWSNKKLLYFALLGSMLLIIGLYFSLTQDTSPEEGSSNSENESSIAVLAFTDMSEAKNQEYFVDGISEEIIHKLSKYKDIKVTGRTSSFYYKNRETPVDKIGQELGVAYVLDGSVRKSADRFRITVQLISTSDGSQIWSDTFDREIEDVLNTQDEIASTIAQRLNVTLLSEDVILRKVDPVAYELYLKSKEALRQADELPTILADSLIKESLKIDSTYSPSWSVLASTTYHKTFFYNHLDRKEGIQFGKKAAKKALKLDSENPIPYLQLGLLEWELRDVYSAIEIFQLANEISPNDYSVLTRSGSFAVKTNQLLKGKEYLIRAIDIDPKNSFAYYWLSWIYWCFGELEKAKSNLQLSYEFGSNDFFENYEMAAIYRELGQYDKTLEYINKENNSYLQLLMKCGYEFAIDNAEEANRILDEIMHYPEDQYRRRAMPTPEQHYYEVAILCAYLGDIDNAFIYLDKAYVHIAHFTDWLFAQPEFKNIQNDPRWNKFVDRLNDDFNYNFYSE